MYEASEVRIEAVLCAAGLTSDEVARALTARRDFMAAHGRPPRYHREVQAHAAGQAALEHALELARLAERDVLGRSADALPEAAAAAGAWLDARVRWMRLARVIVPVVLTALLGILAVWDSAIRRAFFPTASEAPSAAGSERSPPPPVEGAHEAVLAEGDRLWRALAAAPPLRAEAPPGDLPGLLAWARLSAEGTIHLRGFSLDGERLRAEAHRHQGRPRAIVLHREAPSSALLLISSRGTRLLEEGRAWWR